MSKRVGQKNWMRMLAAVLLALASAAGAVAQQMPQPLAVHSDYTIKPGKEADFLDLVNKVGAPVRDKLMKDGVVLAWGVEVPLIRGAYGSTTHSIWYAVADWAGIEKVQTAMAAQIQKIGADEAKAADEARKKKQKPEMSTMERANDIWDASKTRDWYTRHIVFATGSAPMPAGMLPFVRYNFAQVKPGKSAEYQAWWGKYIKPVLDGLVKDGTVGAYGLSVEEVKTTNDFTHFSWVSVNSLGALDKVRAAVFGSFDKRTAEEREAIFQAVGNLTDATASRALVTRAIIFREASMK
jgi:hypothetical protein